MAWELAGLKRSLARQRALFDGSIVLTPVDNFPALRPFDDLTRWTHGLYASDKARSEEQLKQSEIAFAGRGRMTRDIRNIHAALAARFGGANASLRFLSGLHAHIILFMGLAQIGARVALLPPEAGGHFATPGILTRLGLRVEPLAVDRQRMCVDQPASLRRMAADPPDILFIDRSEGLKFEDFSAFAGLDVPIKIFDSSQYAAQILCGLYPNPFAWGFDLQVLTLHKSFPGPQKAAVVGRDDRLWAGVMAGAGAFVSSSHVENSYLVGLLLARGKALETYAARLVPVAEMLESALHDDGVSVILRERVGAPEWPGTQHVWIAMEDRDRAYEAWRALERNRIQANYRKLPYGLGWGLRLGVTAAVSRGLTLASVPALARLISRILAGPPSRDHRREVTGLARAIRADGPFGNGA
jgi:glycine hydroxymethyltransferase